LENRQQRWTLAIFGALLCCAVAAFLSDNPAFALAPDYLLLAFFATRLYYSERLAFFDVFLRGGAYFSAGAVLLGLLLLAVPTWRNVLGRDWNRVWLAALTLMPIWLIGPFLYRHLSIWIDRRALNRRYSRIDAERVFTQAVQAAGTEEQLRDDAIQSLEVIFNCRVEADFDREAGNAKPGDLLAAIRPTGFVRLQARDNQAPFLSDDRSLLQALTAMLGILLQDVRFRLLRQHQLIREQELLALASRAELRALRAQINPHFLFNALNAVAGCIRTRPEVADDTLAQLAEVFRYTLSRSHNEWVRLAEEFDFVRSYLAVEQVRFGDRLQTTVTGDSAAADASIPAMIIQPLVENAIQHGTSRVIGNAKVAIDITLHGGVLRIEVSDNGPGFPAGFTLTDARSGHGLRNVAERLQGYYGDGGVLRWQNSAMGAIVTIEISTEMLRQCAS
jgi:two-component sensor histidine kinase